MVLHTIIIWMNTHVLLFVNGHVQVMDRDSRENILDSHKLHENWTIKINLWYYLYNRRLRWEAMKLEQQIMKP